jgi:hypothetical protein
LRAILLDERKFIGERMIVFALPARMRAVGLTDRLARYQPFGLSVRSAALTTVDEAADPVDEPIRRRRPYRRIGIEHSEE